MARCLLITLAIALVGPSACAKSHARSRFPLRRVEDVPLPGGATRFDYQEIDPENRRLYIAHLGDSSIEVVDLDHLTVTRTIRDVPSVHGLRLAPDLGLLYASATGDDEVVAIDTTRAEIDSRVRSGRFPDGIAYDPGSQRVYVSNLHDTAETVIDARTATRLASVEIDGEAGNSVYDPNTGAILVNVQDRAHIAAIDPATNTVTGSLDTPGCQSNHGLYLDATSRLAFVACEDNAKLLVVDVDSGRAVEAHEVGDGPDVLAFDAGLRRLYVASESGTVAIFEEHRGHLRKLGSAKVAAHAHSVSVDPATHRVFFPLEDVGGRPVLRVMEPL